MVWFEAKVLVDGVCTACVLVSLGPLPDLWLTMLGSGMLFNTDPPWPQVIGEKP